eukprot:SAG11_NODE_3176_length_2631_cov_1.661532_4_plen_108_part_00
MRRSRSRKKPRSCAKTKQSLIRAIAGSFARCPLLITCNRGQLLLLHTKSQWENVVLAQAELVERDIQIDRLTSLIVGIKAEPCFSDCAPGLLNATAVTTPSMYAGTR